MMKKACMAGLALAVVLSSCSIATAYITVNMPKTNVTLRIQYPGSQSYFSSQLSNITPGYGLENATYFSWCGDRDRVIYINYNYTKTHLYSIYNTSMPDYLWHENLRKVNYIFNHKAPNASYLQVQYAIWYLLNYGNYGLDSDGWSMVQNATQYGDCYNPTYFDIIGVVADPGRHFQRHFIEFRPVNPTIENFTVTDALNGKLNLSWDPVVHSIFIQHYEVYRDGVFLVNVTSTSYLDSSIVMGQTYSYKVRAVDLAGNKGPFSNEVSGVSYDTQPPSKVQNVSVTDEFNGKLNVTWDPASDNAGVDHYEIFRDSFLFVNVTSTYYLDIGLVIGRQYNYSIRAVDFAENKGAFSDEVSGVSNDTVPPSQVHNLQAVDAKDGKIDLSWDPATDNVAVDHYEIFRDGVLIHNTSDFIYEDTGRTIGQQYSYKVRAVDTAGNFGEFSNTVNQTSTATPPEIPPSPPPSSHPLAHRNPNLPPVADLSAGEPYLGIVHQDILFNGSLSHDPDGTITQWFWDFGDGTYGTGKIVNHNYSMSGKFMVTLTVTDNNGAHSSDMTNATVLRQNHPPSAATITGPTEGIVNFDYTYLIVATDQDHDLLMYTVRWGDGQSNLSDVLPVGEVYSVKHRWSEQGNYTIMVSARDSTTNSTANKTIVIRRPIVPTDNNLWLILLAILALLLLLILIIAKRQKDKEEDKKKK